MKLKIVGQITEYDNEIKNLDFKNKYNYVINRCQSIVDQIMKESKSQAKGKICGKIH